MIIVGISWLFYWALIDVFKVETLQAALFTGIVFILVALAGYGYEHRDNFGRKV